MKTAKTAESSKTAEAAETAEAYSQVIAKTAGMVGDRSVQRLAAEHGLHVLDVTWEDTARFDSSAVGSNISDMTIQIQHQIPGTDRFGLTCMPVIRYPNFTDLSGDKATSNGVVSEADMADIAEQVDRVYRQADYVGSLVIDGPTGRPTEHSGPHSEPPDWWDTFWARHLQNTGQTRAQALATLEKLLGRRLHTATLEEAEAAFGKGVQG